VVARIRDGGFSGKFRGLKNPPREFAGPTSPEDAGSRFGLELGLLSFRSRCWASCDRGLHERPMKIKVARFEGEGQLSRPVILSAEFVPISLASSIEGVGRTRP
jgi:hypothetical protein